MANFIGTENFGKKTFLRFGLCICRDFKHLNSVKA